MKRFVQFYAKDYGSEKMKEGAVSRISRVKSFLHYMSKGKGRLHEWAFLYDVARIKEWVQDLRTSGKQITTVRYYIHHVAQFLDYMLTTRPPHTRLTVEQNREILRYVEKARKETKREIVLHQNRVKRRKMEKLPGPEAITTCLRLAPVRINELLVMSSNHFVSTVLKCTRSLKALCCLSDELEKYERRTPARYLMYGYMTAYWACLTGHRRSVFINMKEKELVASEKEMTNEGVLIRLSEHKTSVQFGEASLALTAEELHWLKRLLALK
ncbi:uncharacterized protein LOC108228920 isoform X1 [Kryptolebias marmoratus]|uniref:uncharacterized protein LOC108228920 isoform X1 n=2 Tax=Kryptolebias marmoratus TaxID=37003 RepID=UPI0018ACFE31|nr:uncharacterized protein LOC108228920 isoform X1 [Kryptolebias marmoratus]